MKPLSLQVEVAGPTASGEPLLAFDNLTKTYGGFSLEGFSLTVEPGMVVGLMGTNGAGKSTALRCALGLASPTAGDARIMGVSSRELDSRDGRQALERVGVVFDTTPYPGALRVRQVARVMARLYASWDDACFQALAERLGLPGGNRVRELSRGMGMKLQLACALSHEARLLVLDEATAGLDPLAREDVLDMVRSFMGAEGHGVLIASHITTDLEELADVVCCLDEGKTAFCLPKDDVCDRMGVARVRTADLPSLAQRQAFGPGPVRALARSGVTSVLLDDRRAFAHAWPDVTCELLCLEEYMQFILRGENL